MAFAHMRISARLTRRWLVYLECGHENILNRPVRVETYTRNKALCDQCGWQRVMDAFPSEAVGKELRISSGKRQGRSHWDALRPRGGSAATGASAHAQP